ncbi:MAG TPA: response regulator transcription factor [Chloroflexi bacterium]|nr:response regulator transcription factor [Chloroflexota bacterium]
MHILILAPDSSTAQQLQDALCGIDDRYTVATTWADAASALEIELPDLVLIERSALARIEPTNLLNMMESGRWPTILLMDIPFAQAVEKLALAKRLTKSTPPSYQIGELCIDTRKKRAGLGERWVTLPPIQYRLLLTLARRVGEVVSYRELLQTVWGYDGDDNEARELLKEHIRRIRRRLRMDPKEHRYIRSVRGFGYMLAPPDED